MSLPIVTLNINYEDEKGGLGLCFVVLTFILSLDKIKDFLSKFKSQETDLAKDFANIDIDDDEHVAAPDTTSLKYMNQLVRVLVTF